MSYSSMMPRGRDIRSLTGLSSMLTYTVINLVPQAAEKTHMLRWLNRLAATYSKYALARRFLARLAFGSF